MSFARRTVSGNPIFLTIFLGIGGFFASVMAPDAEDPTSYKFFYSLIFFALMSTMSLWLGAIYKLGTSARQVRPSWAFAFALIPACMTIVGSIIGYSATVGEPMFAPLLRSGIGIFFLASVWKSAEAMETALDGAGAGVGRIARTAGYLLFSIVGIWVLRDRLLALSQLAETRTAGQSEVN